jgi:uncharacterized membrane protein
MLRITDRKGAQSNVSMIRVTVVAATPTTYSMSGTIHSGSDSGPVLSGATVSIASKTATTSSTGTFSITNITAGTYAFSVSKSGYNTYTNPAYYVGSNQSGLNFYLTQNPTTGGVYGKLHINSASGSALSGATVTCGGKSATTGSDGSYTITEITPGTQTLSFSKSGYIPYSKSISITTGQNTSAGDNYLTIPTIAQTPMSGHAGTTFKQWGTGFTPNSTATLYFPKYDGINNGSAQQSMDSQGHFDISYPSSSNKPKGSYKWYAIDGPTGIKSNEITYVIN